jgi:hypothetical protein
VSIQVSWRLTCGAFRRNRGRPASFITMWSEPCQVNSTQVPTPGDSGTCAPAAARFWALVPLR